MIRLWAACRNTSVSRTTGTTPLSIRCRSTMPGPTDGNWSTSPTSSRLALGRQGAEQVAHQRHVHHRGLVHDQQVALQGTALVARKRARGGLDFEQAVDRLGLHAGRLGEPLGGATGRGAQQAAHLLGPQDEQDGVDQRGLAHARPAGDDQRPAGQRLLRAPPAGWAQAPCRSSAGTRPRPSRNQSAGSWPATRTAS